MTVAHRSFLAAALILAISGGALAEDFTLDVKTLDLMPADAAAMKASVHCSEDEKNKQDCDRLEGVRPLLTITLLNPDDAKTLKNPHRPLAELVGIPATTALEKNEGGELCMRHRVASEAFDQYGGLWKVAAFMTRVPGTSDQWEHRWAVKPLFSGYRSDAKGVTVIWSEAESRFKRTIRERSAGFE